MAKRAEEEAQAIVEAEEERYRRRNLVSKGGRTTISVEMAEDGSALITVDRDGHRVHRFDVMREPAQKAGTGT